MSKTVPVRIKSAGGGANYIDTVEVAGVNLASRCCALKLQAEVGGVVTLTLEMLAMHGLDIELPANVVINMVQRDDKTSDD